MEAVVVAATNCDPCLCGGAYCDSVKESAENDKADFTGKIPSAIFVILFLYCILAAYVLRRWCRLVEVVG